MDCFGVTEQVTCTTKYTEGRKRHSTHFRMFHNNRQITVSTLQFTTIAPHTIMHYLKTIYTATITALKYICNILLQPDICVFFNLSTDLPTWVPVYSGSWDLIKLGHENPNYQNAHESRAPSGVISWFCLLCARPLCCVFCWLGTWKQKEKMLCEEQQHCLDVVTAGHNLVILGQVSENDESLLFIL